MGKIRLKIKSHPPLLLSENNFNLPSPTDNIMVNPPLPCFPLALVPSYLICVLDVFLRHKRYFKWSSMYEFSPLESLDSDSKVVSSSHELLNSSTSRTSLAAFSRAWLRTTRLVKSALLPLILRPCCFNYISSWLFVSASISVSFSKKLDGRAFLFLNLFFRLCIQELKVLYITFARSLVHVVLGTELLQRTFFRGGNFPSLNNFFIWTLGRSL